MFHLKRSSEHPSMIHFPSSCAKKDREIDDGDDDDNDFEIYLRLELPIVIK